MSVGRRRCGENRALVGVVAVDRAAKVQAAGVKKSNAGRCDVRNPCLSKNRGVDSHLLRNILVASSDSLSTTISSAYHKIIPLLPSTHT